MSTDAGAGDERIHGSGPCTIAPGTYTQHFTAEPGGTNCPTIFDQPITVHGAVTGSDGGLPTDSTCAWNLDSSTCTLATSCTATVEGFTYSISGTIGFDASTGSGSGKATFELKDSAGDVVSSCVYDVTIARGG